MEEHDETTTPDSEAPAAAPGPAQRLARDVATLRATVDQHSAEIDAIGVEQMILVFALGALAGIVFLHHREVRRLAGELGG